MRADPTRDRSGGFVLVAVLSVMALLALMLGASALLARGAIETSLLEDERLRDEALLSAGLALAGHQIFGLRLSPDAISGQQARLNDGTVTIFVASEAGRVDLNGSDELLLASAYRASGLAGLSPEAFAENVATFRSSGGDGAPAFRTLGDLRFVEGVALGDIAALEPYLTIFNPAGRIDPIAAARPLIVALPGISEDSADEVMALPADASTQGLFVLRSVFRGLERQLFLGEPSRAFAVRLEARRRDGGPVRTARAVLIAPVISTRPYHLVDWQQD